VHARCGFIINTLRKKTFSTGLVLSEKTTSIVLYVVLQLPLLLLANSTPAESLLISSLTGFSLPEM